MNSNNLIEKLNQTKTFIDSKTSLKPKVAVILGSGLGAFADHVNVEVKIPFSQIPHFNSPSVEGHGGYLIIGTIENKPVLILQGRIHFYEGHSIQDVVFPIRAAKWLGIEKLLITNSAGGMGDGMKEGDLMIIEDQINLSGVNPLIGPNEKELGPRFNDMTESYSKELSNVLESIMKSENISYKKGVYCGVSGPCYETPAEIRMFKMLGASAVGMSTVAECIAANHCGLKVVGVSCVTNLAAGISKQKLSHEEVTETAKRVEKSFITVVKKFLLAV